MGQGDLICEAILEKNEFDNMNFTDPESIIISPNSEELTGVSKVEADIESPTATDTAIKKTKEKEEKGEKRSELGQCIDFYKDKNEK